MSTHNTTKVKPVVKTNTTRVSDTGKVYKPLKTRLINASQINTTRYQRAIEKARVDRIISDFRMEQLNVLKVALRSDGIYYLIDGQHTYIAATTLFGKDIDFMCNVVDCTSADWEKLTEEQFEARIFTHQHDNTKQLSAQEKFYGAYLGGEKREIEIVESLEELGYTVQMTGRPLAVTKSIACVKNLVDIYDKHGLDKLVRTIKIIDEAYGGSAESLQDKFMYGVASFIATYEEHANYSDKEFGKALYKNASEPKKLMEMARAKHERFKMTSKLSLAKCVEEQFLEVFNKGKQTKNRVYWE